MAHQTSTNAPPEGAPGEKQEELVPEIAADDAGASAMAERASKAQEQQQGREKQT